MKKEKGDLRIRRTRASLWQALMSLIAEKDFDALTVQDITERAMVNRSTFYKHFEDKNDLLLSGIDEMLQTLGEKLELPEPGIKHYSSIEKMHVRNSRLVFEHVKENAAFYRAMLGENGSLLFANRMRLSIERIYKDIATFIRAQKKKALIPLEFASAIYASSLMSIIVWWLTSDMPYSPEQMARYLTYVDLYGFYASLGLGNPKMKEPLLF